jgi:hypothetical protein
MDILMKPHTQLLRAFPAPDPKKMKKDGRRRSRSGGASRDKSPIEEQREEMEEVHLSLGPDAWPWFGPMLVFDCETTTGIGQELRFGWFQERGVNYRKLVEHIRFDGVPTRAYMDQLRSEGLFYNPKTCSGNEVETMRAYCETQGVRFLTLDEFLERRVL